MRKIAFVGLSLFVVIGAAQILFADGGKIPFRSHVKIFEPNQNALIAWNGEEEILLLTTNIRSSEPTKVLEIVPFPSEPKAKKGDSEVIRKAVNLINSKLPRAIPPRRYSSKGSHLSGGAAKPKPPAGELTFHDKIGSHDISVTHVLNKEGFVDWVQKYLKSAGVDNPEVPEDMQKVVQEYLTDGFNWFVFDVVDVKEDIATTEAIQYQFKTKSLFYPMRISRAIQGASQVKLLVFTHDHVLVKKEVGVNWKIPFSHIRVSQDEAMQIDNDMAELLGPGENILRIWEFKGSLSSFTNDLVGESLKYSTSDQALQELIRARNGTALVAAAKQSDLIQVRKLLDCGFGANWPATRPMSIVGEGYRPPPPRYVGFTALQNSAQNGYADIVKLLLDRGADVNLSTMSGGSPLMQAAANGRVDVVRVLLKKGANVSHNDNKGRTALHGAAEKGYDKVVGLLLEKGANVAAKTTDGRTALQLAAERGHTGTVKLLKSHGARE